MKTTSRFSVSGIVITMAMAAVIGSVVISYADGQVKPAAGEGRATATSTTASAPGAKIVGWRGDGTGCYPDATPPVEWSRKSQGIARGLLTQAKKPAGESIDGAKPMLDGVIRQWLVVGPFTAADPAKALDQEQIAGEDKVGSDQGDKVGELAWQIAGVVGDKDDVNQYNTVSLNWVYLKGSLSMEAGQVGYAHSYVYAKEAGMVKVIIDHAGALKVRANGKVVYDQPKSQVVYGAANNDVYWLQSFIPIPRSVTFQMDLVKGWNRLLFKGVCALDRGCQFNARFADPLPAKYETKNILWTTTLPGFANAMPVIVGDKIFVTSEPDELVCVNKKDGKVLWKRSYSHYDTLTAQDRLAHPIIAEKIDPLVKKLGQTEDADEKLALRKQIRDAMMTIDKVKYALRVVKHLPIVGYCTPTPCSDGKFVYTISGNGVAACFDLDGKPQWIRHAHAEFKGRQGGWASHGHPSSPVLIDNKFIFHLDYVVALDVRTGKEIWRADTDGGNATPDVINGSLWATMDGGTPVVGTAGGLFYNANNGQPTWEEFAKLCRESGQYVHSDSRPCFLIKGNPGGIVPMAGATKEYVAAEKRPAQIDRTYTGGMLLSSPLCHEGLIYMVNMTGGMTVMDAKTGATVYTKKLDLNPYMFWNGSGVCASVALGGKNIYVMDNRGNTIVFKPGRQFEQVARNTIEDNLPRRIPDNPQELTQSTPAFDGGCIYIRGEENLYCIGEK